MTEHPLIKSGALKAKPFCKRHEQQRIYSCEEVCDAIYQSYAWMFSHMTIDG
jgi:hypothetical protein